MITMLMWRTILVLLLLAPLLSSQAVLSGNAQISGNAILSGGIQYSTTWSEYARRSTLAVGIIRNDGNGERFVTGAAAVIIRDQRNRVFVATALHVFSEPSSNWAPETLQLRGWRDEQRSPFEDLGTELVLIRNSAPLYVASKNLDLAVVAAPPDLITRLLDPATGKIYTLAPDDIGGADDTYDGADIFIPGRVSSRGRTPPALSRMNS